MAAEASQAKAEVDSRVQQAKNASVPVTQAAAGIVVTAIGTTILCFLGFWLFMRRKRSQSRHQLGAVDSAATGAAGSSRRMTSEEEKRGILGLSTTHVIDGSGSNSSSRDGHQMVTPASWNNAAAAAAIAPPIPSRTRTTGQLARPSSPATVTDGGLSTGVTAVMRTSTPSAAGAASARRSELPFSVRYASSDFSSQTATAWRPSTANLSAVPSVGSFSLAGGDDERVSGSRSPFFQQRLGRVQEERPRPVAGRDIRQSWKSGAVSPVTVSDTPSLPSVSEALKKSRRNSNWPLSTEG
ncbi:hypothetical protein MAPG_06061 [Magnaporthiopsis poae ATCC 64411]|uniref:Uncharacterized protein n=1 Tax=Magnaporthiopsis poae (strain ATCC 64411 / 73-15) TaxID=644358 RepID=A0A0C4E118_MAGP6|nr:hypothetical protein MAPG_06061 [Magnaporthiopsis poae ATCC 64411]